jgi:alanine racemase
LRDAGIEKPIVVISPILAVEAEQAVFYRLRTLVERLEIAGALSHAAVDQDSTAIIHLEVETGLARFGAMPSEALDLACNIASLPGVKLEGLSTHFANSGRDPETTNLQLERFHRVLADCETAGLHFDVVHAATSAGAVRYPASRHDLVRIGLGAYGIEPYGLFEGVGKPVMTWKARVMALRDLPQGSPVSYSGTFTTSRRTVVATLGVGYGDGYPRALSNKGVVILNGVECPVIGLVCMDQVLVDATDLGSVTLGDEAILLGGQVPADRLSALIDTTPHEITTRIAYAIANDERTEDVHVETARLYSLYMELFCDRGAHQAAQDKEAVLSCLIKLHTGLAQVNTESYLKQAEEVVGTANTGSEGPTHPENYVRCLALHHWSGGEADAQERVERLVRGPLDVNNLDLFRQKELQQLTRDLLLLAVKPNWIWSTAVAALCKSYFPEIQRTTEVFADEKLRDTIKEASEGTRNYLCYVLLDVARCDSEQEEVPLGHVLEIVELLGLNSEFETILRKELKLGARELKALKERAMAGLAKMKDVSTESLQAE